METSLHKRATIDGKSIEFTPGQTILETAQEKGFHIPTLCFHPSLPLEGGCRMCVVEAGANGSLVGACHTPMQENMEVITASDRIRDVRSGLMSLMLSRHDKECFTSSENGNEFERLIGECGVNERLLDFQATPSHDSSTDGHPYLRFIEDRCIVCRRCLHACERVQGQFVYGIGGRGAHANLIFGDSNRFAETDCTACGACVDACPTAALTDIDRKESRPAERTVRSTCGYCGVGCQIDVDVVGDTVTAIQGTPTAEVNRGHLCAKGRYAHGYQRSPDRLKQPLLRKNGGFEEVSWETAIAWVAERITALKESHGPNAFGAFAASRSTNEAAYLLQKFMRTIIGTDNIDCCARVCHSSTALALQRVTGTGAASASYEDIECASCIFVAGANPTEAHPVVGARIKQAALNGVPLIVADPRQIELAAYSSVHLQLAPGTNVPLFNAIAKLLIERGTVDTDYVSERVEGFDTLKTFLADATLEDLLDDTGVATAEVSKAADLIAAAKPVLFVHGLGLSELTQGTESVMALCNLGMLTGSIGAPGAGMLPLRGQNNVQGAADMGAAPGLVTGYQNIEMPDVRSHIQSIWGAELPTEKGLTTTEMLEAAIEGHIRALWVQGEDLVHSDPYESRTISALESLDLLIVQDPFFNETARYADLVLPAATTLENDGTYTNGERRIQRVRPVAPPPGQARQDWEITRDIANALGAGWTYESPAEIMDEIALTAPAKFGGIAYDRLDENGIQWPCPARDHAGTASVHADGFLRGKGQLSSIPYRPSPEETSDEFPLLLVTGRVLQQYNVGTMTRRTPSRELASEDYLEMHPDDAERLEIEEGSSVQLTSRWGSTKATVKLASRVAPGTLFVSFHYPESHVNRLIGPHVDPDSKCPEYKLAAVRVERQADSVVT